MIGVFLVNALAVILKCHVFGVRVYVTTLETSPGKPWLPSASKSVKVMEFELWAETVQFLYFK